MSQAWTGLRAGEGLRAKVAGSPPGWALEDETGVPGGRWHGKRRPVSGERGLWRFKPNSLAPAVGAHGSSTGRGSQEGHPEQWLWTCLCVLDPQFCLSGL